MKNQRGSADSLNLIVPAGGVTSGQIVVIGAMVVVAHSTEEAGGLFRGETRGEYVYAKPSGTAIAQGAQAFYDPTNDVVTPTSASGRFPIGYFPAAADSADTEAHVVLTGEATAAVA